MTTTTKTTTPNSYLVDLGRELVWDWVTGPAPIGGARPEKVGTHMRYLAEDENEDEWFIDEQDGTHYLVCAGPTTYAAVGYASAYAEAEADYISRLPSLKSGNWDRFERACEALQTYLDGWAEIEIDLDLDEEDDEDEKMEDILSTLSSFFRRADLGPDLYQEFCDSSWSEEIELDDDDQPLRPDGVPDDIWAEFVS